MRTQELWFKEQEVLEVLTEKPQFLREIARKIKNKGIFQILPVLEGLLLKGLVLKTKIKNRNLYQIVCNYSHNSELGNSFSGNEEKAG